MAGLDACLRAGADIIVNTDAKCERTGRTIDCSAIEMERTVWKIVKYQ